MAGTMTALHMTDGPLEILTEARRPEGARELTEADLALLTDMCGSLPTMSEGGERLRVRIHLPVLDAETARSIAARLLRSALALIGATSWRNSAIIALLVAPDGSPIADLLGSLPVS